MKRRLYIVAESEKQLKEMIEAFEHHGPYAHCIALVHHSYMENEKDHNRRKVGALDVEFETKCDLCNESAITHIADLEDIAQSKYLCGDHWKKLT